MSEDDSEIGVHELLKTLTALADESRWRFTGIFASSII
jgi:hypothetical protein